MLKATLCRKGNGIIYDICKKLGKFIVATDENDIRKPDKLINNGRKNGIDDLVMLDGRDVSSMEPNVTALRAIFSPSTGIIEFVPIPCRQFHFSYSTLIITTESRTK